MADDRTIGFFKRSARSPSVWNVVPLATLIQRAGAPSSQMAPRPRYPAQSHSRTSSLLMEHLDRMPPARSRQHRANALRFRASAVLRDNALYGHRFQSSSLLMTPAQRLGHRAVAKTFLEPLIDQLQVHGVGSLAEIFDGGAPHCPRGAIAQAWTVAETLRAWQRLSAVDDV